MKAELRHLEAFVAVADELHFGRAAERLHITQPALSRTVQQLEQVVGARLLERTTRSVVLTAPGRELLDRARAALAAVDHALAVVSPVHHRLRGRLRVRCAPDTEEIAAAAAAALRVAHPAVEMAVTVFPEVTSALEDVRGGAADAALVWNPASEDRRGLSWAVVRREETGCVLPGDHRLAAADVVRVADLTGEPLVLFPRWMAPGIWDHLVGHLSEHGRPPPVVHEVDVVTSGQTAMVEAVRAGRGVSGATLRVFRRLQPEGLVLRPLDPPLVTTVEAAWPVRHPPVVAAFIDELGRPERSRTDDRALTDLR